MLVNKTMLKEREAILLNKSNNLEKIVIQHSSDNIGWTLTLVEKNGDEFILRPKRYKNPRIFKTSDACLDFCKRIGAKSITILLDE